MKNLVKAVSIGGALLLAGACSAERDNTTTPARVDEDPYASSTFPLSPQDPLSVLPLDPANYPAETPPPPRRITGPKEPAKAEALVDRDGETHSAKSNGGEEHAPPSDAPGSAGASGNAPPIEQPVEVVASPPVAGATDEFYPGLDTSHGMEPPGQQTKSLDAIKDTVSPKPGRATKLFINWPDGQGGSCSGALIGTKTVLTAGHCMYRGSHGGWASSIMVVPGLDQQYMPYGNAWSASPMASTEWLASENDDYDWGILILDRHIGSSSVAGYLGLASLSDSTWDLPLLIEMYGYPETVGNGIQPAYSGGAEECSDSTMVYHNADTAGGLSGAGIMGWAYWPEHVAAVHTGTDYNLLCSLSELRRSTRITSSRYNLIMAYRDDPSVPVQDPSQYPWVYHDGFPRSPVGMVSPAASSFDMFIRGTNGAVWMQQLTPSAWLPSIGTWTSIGGSVLGEVSAVSRAQNQVDLFIRQNTGGMLESATPVCTKARNGSNWWPSLTTWSCFTDFTTVQWPTAVSRGSDKLDVFGVANDGRVYNKRWTQQSGWLAPIDLGGTTDYPVAVVSSASGWWDAFIRDASTGRICTKGFDGTAYHPSQTGWTCLTQSEIVGAPTAVSYGTNSLDVVGIRSDGKARRMYWRGSSWLGPTDLGGNFNGTVEVVSRTSNQLDFFARDTSGAIYTKSLTGTTWAPSQTGWWTLGGDAIDVSAVSSGSSRLDVVMRARNDLAARHRWWDGTQWRP